MKSNILVAFDHLLSGFFIFYGIVTESTLFVMASVTLALWAVVDVMEEDK